MLKQHQFYVYYQENQVLARMGTRPPVVAKVCANAQEAHDEVQKIINPEGKPASAFWEAPIIGQDAEGSPILGEPVNVGYHAKEFQDSISKNCEEFVRAAYAKAEH